MQKEGLIGMSLIIHAHKGKFLATKVVCDRGLVGALVVEALNCRKALQWLKENGFHKVIVESDSLLLVSAVNISACYSSPIGLIFHDCKELFQVIPDSSLFFARRSTKRVVHILSRVTGSLSGYGKWVQNPPSFIRVVISSEMD